MRLQDKTCIVTGAGAGIGFATANAFTSEETKVIALDRAIYTFCHRTVRRMLPDNDGSGIKQIYRT